MGAELLKAPAATGASTAVRHRSDPDPLVAAVLDELARDPRAALTTSVTVVHDPAAAVHVDHGPRPAGPVLVALDDDANAAALTAYGMAEANRRGVALRTVYVWTDCRPPDCDHHRACHRDLADAAQLLADIIEQYLTAEELEQVERDVVHGSDPAATLSVLSGSASLLVVGASSDLSPHGPIGATTRELLARVRCPLAVVPTTPPRFSYRMRRPAPPSGTFDPDRRHRPGTFCERSDDG